MRKPDVKGDAALAWLVPKERMEVYAMQHPEEHLEQSVASTVCLYYVNGRGFHPFWMWWAIACVDLRAPGPPPNLHYPAAEYELMTLSLDPNAGSPPINGDGPFRPLGVDLAIQFHGLNDKQARDVTRFYVEAVCAGNTSPDRDWQASNRASLTKLVSDYYIGRYGGTIRSRRPDVDEAGIFTGEEEPEPWFI